MGALRKIGKNWQIETCRNGVRVRRIVESSKRIALHVLAEFEGRRSRGEYSLGRDDVSVKSLFERYRAYDEANLTPKAGLRYGNVIDRFQEFLDTQLQNARIRISDFWNTDYFILRLKNRPKLRV